MSRPKLLDLYSCAGGAGMGYYRAGFDVYSIDVEPQVNNPFPFRQDDALEAVELLRLGLSLDFHSAHGNESLSLQDFHAIHASPPCQSYMNLGAVNRALGRAYDHADMIEATRDQLFDTDLPYVIENVEDAKSKLESPVRVCGTGLGLPLRRHRLFESNIEIAGIECHHKRFTEKKYWTGWRPAGQTVLSTVVQVYGNAGGRHEWPAAMGIDWMTPKEMTEAIPPAYTEHIGRQLIADITSECVA